MSGRVTETFKGTLPALIIVHIAIAWVTNSYSWFFGNFADFTNDVHEYYVYGLRSLQGGIPYRDYLVEYPPIAFLLFVAPCLIAKGFADYRVAFAGEMLLFDGIIIAMLAHWIARMEGRRHVPARLAWYTLFFAILSPLTTARFDLAPTMLAFGSAFLWFSGRSRAGGMLAALGFLAKMFPGLIAIPVAISGTMTRNEAKKGIIWLIGVIIAGMGEWFLLAGPNLAHTFRFHMERGLEIGSLYASLLMAASNICACGVHTVFDHGSVNVVADDFHYLTALSGLIQLGMIVVVIARFRLSGMQDGMRWAAALILACIAAAKVLSPQYLIWLMPFMAVLQGKTGKWARVLYLVCCILTTAIFPHYFNALSALDRHAVYILLARNLLLVTLLAVLLFGPADQKESKCKAME